ncbi:MAG: hypothetical protein ERJ68_06680 [Aphanocapsa feldmannii 277cI]|uniref:Uncharacterized protein n=1 Tax=Aphanocapsa feldmannii 277cI TaxID=2507554 RepID=A0A524RSP9_9CHRO|nr:MAG: hypothetical protein ERJ68_06680 [Aphanocapsa feldmannii 277cI]
MGQIDRLYDADAYLPLPIGRHAALTGARMPGPTRHRPRDHTYRYYVDRSLRSYLARTRCLPLTPLCPDPFHTQSDGGFDPLYRRRLFLRRAP